MVKAPVETVLFAGNRPPELCIDIPVPGINPAIADHFEMLFRDVPDEPGNEFHGRDRLLDIFLILVAVVVKRDKAAIVPVDPGSCNDRASQIPPDIFDYGSGVAFIRFGINIKAFFVIVVTGSLRPFEGGADYRFHLIKECRTEGVAEVGIAKVIDITPKAIVAVAAF